MASKKQAGAFSQRFEYAAARLVASLFRGLPLPAAARLGRAIGDSFHALDARHRERVAHQVQSALGSTCPPDHAADIARRMYRHLGTMLAEFVRLPSLTATSLADHVDWGGQDEQIREVFARGRGAIFATGHIGNWEFNGFAFHLLGYSAGAVARPLDNPLLERYIRGIRTSRGQQIWDKFGALRSVARVLRDGKGFGILVDQDAGQRGVFVPFFGTECSTMPTPADLALRTGAPIVVCGFHRIELPMRFAFVMRPPRWADPEADPAAERMRLLRGMNEDLEAIIRQAPEQWLWLHRRWKTRPPDEAARGKT